LTGRGGKEKSVTGHIACGIQKRGEELGAFGAGKRDLEDLKA